MRRIIVFVLACITINAFAQKNAVTEDGKKVILYSNGTWEYFEEPSESIVKEINFNIKNITKKSNVGVLFYDISPRLDRYFQSPKDKIRMKSQCLIENGVPKLFFQWEVYLKDGYRYFGYLKKELLVDLIFQSGEKITVNVNESLKTDVREKHGITLYYGYTTLTEDQLKQVLAKSIASIQVNWKKTTENYPLEDREFFKNEFSKLIETE